MTPWKHHPEPVTENKEVKVLWDFDAIWYIDNVIQAQRPDIVVVDKTKRTTTTIHVAVALSWNVKDKEDEKIMKYPDLWI